MEKMSFSCQFSSQELILEHSSPEYPKSKQFVMESWGGGRLKEEVWFQHSNRPGNSRAPLLEMSRAAQGHHQLPQSF